MASLVDRIKKARQTNIKVGHVTLICRRPTDLEMLDMRSGLITQSDILKRFVDGWEGMKELDLVPGGTGDAVPFTREVFEEWVADHPESWTPIAEAVVNAYKAHEEQLEAAAKN